MTPLSPLTPTPAAPDRPLARRLFAAASAPAVALAVSLGLAACGGGGMSTGGTPATHSAPAATPVTVVGTLTGSTTSPQFNQKPVNATAAVVTVNSQPATPASLQPGVVIQGKGTRDALGLTLQSVDVIQELEGPITAVNQSAATLTVLGTTVTVNALTRLEQEGANHGFTTLTLADFAVGDRVSVFGAHQADGSVLATRVERKIPGAAGGVELRGKVASLDPTAQTFMLGTTLVNYAGASLKGTLTEGAPVEVEGALSGTTLMAARVKVEDGSGHALDADVEVSGPLSNLDTTARTFTLLSLTVDYSAATVMGTLVAGATVEAEGAMSPTAPSTLVATKVEVRFSGHGDGASDEEGKGPITALNATDLTLTVGGVTYWTDAQTVIIEGDAAGTFAQLKVGDWVEVRGLSTRTNAAGQPYATRIERESADAEEGAAGALLSLEGTLGAFNAAAQTFTVGSQVVAVTPSTQYRQGATDLTSTQFWGTDRSGARVEVAGQLVAGAFTATEIRLKP